MPITLPENPAPATVTKRYYDYGRVIAGSLGGDDTRLDRPGSRHGLVVEMPPMRGEIAEKYVSRLMRGLSERVIMEWPLGDFDPGTLGFTPQVQGTEPQSGSILRVTNWANDYSIKEGQFFSMIHGGQHYLYHVTEDVEVVRGGDPNIVVELPIFPMLRRPTEVFDPLHFIKPMIEGYVQNEGMDWEQAVSYELGIKFSIKEKN